MHHSASAHGARLNCSKQFAVPQAMVTEVCTGFAQGHDLGMGRGVGIGEVAVPSAADDLVIANDDGANRDLAHFKRTLGAAQGFFHPEFVGGGNGRMWIMAHEVILAAPVLCVMGMFRQLTLASG